jgi:hypothetical protein
VYNNAEAEDTDFTESEGGLVTPLRWPGVCTVSLATCSDDADCGGAGGTCFERDSGNLYQGVHPGADLQYLGTNENSYRISYEKQTNEAEDDFSDIIALTFATDPDTTSDANYESAINAIADEDEWARFFAVHMLLVNQGGRESTGIPATITSSTWSRRIAARVQHEADPARHGFHVRRLRHRSLRRRFGGRASRRRSGFVRNNAYAGRFVGAICDLLDTDFTPGGDEPPHRCAPAPPRRCRQETQFKNWVGRRSPS